MLIECSVFNYQIFIPLIYPIFIQIKSKIEYIYIKKDNILFKIFRYYLSYNLSFIFLLIVKYRTRSTVRKTNDNDNLLDKNIERSSWINPLDIEQKKLIRRKKLKSRLFIILLIVFSFLPNLVNQIYKDDDINIGKQSIGVLFEILFFIILSIILLKEKLYRHHYFSLYIISFTLLILVISFIICHKEKKVLKAILFYFVLSFLFCLYDVLGKKYMNLYYDSPYNIMFTIGLITTIILMIYDTIVYIFFKVENYGIIIGFQENINFSSFFLFLLELICEFLWNLGIWLTLYYFTPCHFIISESISEYIYYTIDAINSDDGNKHYSSFNIILYSVCYVINIISALIFNEIIILNFRGLSEFTKKEIRKRERIDTLIAFKRYNDTIATTNTNQSERNESLINLDENNLKE